MVDRQVTVTAKLNDRASTGLVALGGTVTKVLGTITGATAAIAPLLGRLAALATLATAVSIGRKGVQLAEEQALAEERATQATRGRATTFAELAERASRFQENTRIGDESFLEVQASLLLAGVAAGDLERATLAVANTAEATGQSYELIGRSIGQFSAGTAGLLTRVVPQLRDLVSEGRLAADGIDFLNEQFEGTAAAIAQTDFGQATQQSNTYGDQLEKLGDRLVNVRTEGSRVLSQFLQPFVELAGSPIGRGIETGIRLILELFGRITPTVAKIILGFIAFKVAAIALSLGVSAIIAVVAPVITVIGGVVAAIGPLPLLLAGVTVAVLAATGNLKSFFGVFTDPDSAIGQIIAGIRKEFNLLAGVVESVSKGTLEIGDAFEFIKDRIAIASTFTFEAFQIAFFGILDLAKNVGFDIGVSLAKSITRGLSNDDGERSALTRAIGGAPLRILDAVVAEAEKSSASSFRNSEQSFRESLEKLVDAGKEAAEGLARNVDDVLASQARLAQVNAFELLEESAAEAEGRIGSLAGEIARLEQIVEDVAKISRVGFGDLIDLDDQTFFDSFEALGEKSGAAFAQAVTASAEDAFSAGEISLGEFFDISERGTVGILDEQLEKLRARLEVQEQITDQVGAERAALEQVAETARSVAATNEAAVEIFDTFQGGLETPRTTESLLEAVELQNEVRDATLEAEQAAERERLSLEQQESILTQIAALSLARLNSERALGAELATIATTAGGELDRVEANLDSSLERIANLARTGTLTQAQIESQVQDVIGESSLAVDELRASLSALSDTGIEVDGLDELDARLARLVTRLRTADISSRTFGQGMGDAARSLQAEVDNVGALGENLASTGLNGFVDTIVTGFQEGGNAARAFGQGVLQQFAQIIQRAAVLRATLALLNFVGSSFGSSVTASAQAKGGAAGHGPKKSYPAELFAHAIHFSRGGAVPGGNIRRDVIPAMLMPREQVMDVDTVNYYGGPKIWEALRRRLIPREILTSLGIGGMAVSPSADIKKNFASGGAVASSAGGVSSGGDAPALFGFVDDDMADRIFSQSQGSPFFKFTAGNKSRVSASINTNRDKRR